MKPYNDIYFLVDTDNTFVQVVKLRIALLKPFGYEIEVDDVTACIIAPLKEEIDVEAEPFVKFEESQARITVDIKISSTDKK